MGAQAPGAYVRAHEACERITGAAAAHNTMCTACHHMCTACHRMCTACHHMCTVRGDSWDSGTWHRRPSHVSPHWADLNREKQRHVFTSTSTHLHTLHTALGAAKAWHLKVLHLTGSQRHCQEGQQGGSMDMHASEVHRAPVGFHAHGPPLLTLLAVTLAAGDALLKETGNTCA